MGTALTYDCVLMSLGRGESDGSLHEIAAVRLAAPTLASVSERRHLDTSLLIEYEHSVSGIQRNFPSASAPYLDNFAVTKT